VVISRAWTPAASVVVAALTALSALAPLATPPTDRPTVVAASPPAAAAALEVVPGSPVEGSAQVDGSAHVDVDEPAVSDGTVTDLTASDVTVSDGAAMDLLTVPGPVDAGATVQRRLVDLGWAVTVDGAIGPRTRRAIAEFQHANGLPPTGNVDAETSIRLRSADANGHQRYLADPLPVPGTPRPAVDRMTRIEQIADSVGFDWRSRGVTFVIGCHPDHQRCTTGSYYTGTRQIFITSSILADEERLRSVVLHELAHAWQFTVRGWPGAADDVSAWGRTGIDGLEAAADCLATAWGASRTDYWSCPADAAAHLSFLYEHS
jgi:hypothetical protein